MTPGSHSNPYSQFDGTEEEETSNPSDTFPAPRPTYRITGRQARPAATSSTTTSSDPVRRGEEGSKEGEGGETEEFPHRHHQGQASSSAVPDGLVNSPARHPRPTSASSSTAALPPRDIPYTAHPRPPGPGKGNRHKKNASYSSASATFEGHVDGITSTGSTTLEEGIQLRKLTHGSERREDPASGHSPAKPLSNAWPLERISTTEEDDAILLAEHTGANNTAQGGARLNRHPLSSPTTPRFRLGGMNEDRYEMGTGSDGSGDMGYRDEDELNEGGMSGAFDLQKLGSGHMDDIAMYIRVSQPLLFNGEGRGVGSHG